MAAAAVKWSSSKYSAWRFLCRALENRHEVFNREAGTAVQAGEQPLVGGLLEF
jgi:hypothetical protein